MEFTQQYRGRITAAWWSKTLLAIAAVISVLLLPFGFDVWSALLVAGVLTVTFFEFRVHHYFRTGDTRAPGLGFRNQSCLAAAILLYGLYHALRPEPIESMLPQWYIEMVGTDAVDSLQTTIRDGYLLIGILGGLSQFGLAWYYRSAGAPAATPDEGRGA
jgi:hypothetical protein